MRRLARAVVLAPVLTGCGAGDDESARALYELERLVFVPATGRSTLEGFFGSAAEYTIPEALLFDQFEATRDDWLWYGRALPDPGTWSLERAWADDVEGSWPATMSQREAQGFAAQRGMRLPRAHEWVHVAIGPRAHKLPWGPTDQRSTANTLELGLGRPLPVGTFENGRSEPFGCYDLLGNVWEWVSDRVAAYGDPPDDDFTPPWRVSAMGGSFLSDKRDTYGPTYFGSPEPVFHAVTLDPDHRAPDLGARCCAEARAYLWQRAPRWGTGEATRARVVAVGERWGREAVAVLEELAARPGAPRGLEWLLEGARLER